MGRFAVLVGLALLAAGAASAERPRGDKLAPPRAEDITELAWIAPGADRVKALTERPPECLVRTDDDRLNVQITMGRIAFESPALLGGAAARGGLSCSSCHVNGRGNPDFFINGVSGAPGTADVTSSIFSKTRGDGVFSPVPIPDLALRDGTQMKDRTTLEFRAKVRALIVEEFEGQEPPAEVMDALIAYMDALRLEACPANSAPVRPWAMQDFVAAVFGYSMVGDRALAADARIFYIRAARLRLQRLDERLPDPRDAELRSTLRKLSQYLGGAALALRAGVAPDEPSSGIATLSSQPVQAAEPRSFYDPDVLRRAFAQAD